MHRDLKAKYQRATEEILEKEIINKEIITEITKLKEEQVDLRALKIQQSSQIVVLNEKVRHLNIEIDIKKENIS